MSEIRLRRAEPPDVAFIVATERLPGFDRFIGQWSAEMHRAAMLRASYAYLIGLRDGEVAGFAIVRDLDDDNGNVCLKRIAVTQPGAGFGTGFLRAIVDWAFRETPVHRFWLDVVPDNHRAQHVYRACGFVLEGRMREASATAEGGRTDLLLMSLTRPEWQTPSAGNT